MLNIVIPMAGRGSRFREAGYTVPKPLIPVRGVPMIQVVINNLRPRRAHRFIFITLREILNQPGVESLLRSSTHNPEVIAIDEVTEGAACTVLLARRLIDNDDPLMIANCDQWVDVDINDYLKTLDESGADGLIMTMFADDPKWSYVKCDDAGRPCEVVEKQVVSPYATVGIYNFRRGRDFVAAADSMIRHNRRVNNEFYVAPIYNEMLRSDGVIALHSVGRVGDGMYGLGTPEDLRNFESLPIATKAAGI
jgi:NDP-sugar pyrophosphorylase family protein